MEKNKPPLGIGDRLRPHYGLDGNERGKVTKDTTTKAVKDKLVQRALDLAAGEIQKKKASKKKKKSSKKEDAVATLASSLQIASNTDFGQEQLSERQSSQEETEEANIARWDDRKLERELGKLLGERCRSRSRQRVGSGDASQKEEPRSSGLDCQDAYRSCQGDVGAGSNYGSVIRRQLCHLRSQSDDLLHAPPAAELWELSEGDERDAPPSCSPRHDPEGGHQSSRRCLSSPVHGCSSVSSGSKLDNGETYGDLSHARNQCGWPITGPGNTEAHPTGGKSARKLSTRKLAHKRARQGLPYRVASLWGNRQEGKGPKGRGKKGKQKGRGKGAWDWNSQGNEWKDTKEKPSEKTS